MNHLLNVWKWLLRLEEYQSNAVFCLKVQMCELVQGRGSSVLESFAVKMLTKLFFSVNVTEAASDRRLLE